MPEYRTYRVSRQDREPLFQFIENALVGSGCRIIRASLPNEAPLRMAFETPSGERIGILAYVFLANSRPTRNRPPDEHRFQVKYGSDDRELHELWQDPYGLYTTLLLGVDLEQGIFVGADPVLHSPTRFFMSIEFKRSHVEAILRDGWHTWERRHRRDLEPVEALVGGTTERFLDYVLLERAALGLDQGHRQLLAERVGSGDSVPTLPSLVSNAVEAASPQLHSLAAEFELSETEVLDLIASARRLKMAVRGWVAEEHLVRALALLPGVSDCRRIDAEGAADVELRFRSSRLLTIECKNVLRVPNAAGMPRVDFQRTRASTADRCSRYYSPADFDVVAACLHAVTERWEFRFVDPTSLAPHRNCEGKLASNVIVDSRWVDSASSVFSAVAAS